MNTQISGWTCKDCGGPVAGPYAKCDNCGLKPEREAYTVTSPPIDLGVNPGPCPLCGEEGHLENQQSITQWADEAFGKVTNFTEAGRRSVEEMTEFAEFLTELQNHRSVVSVQDKKRLVNEAADIVITLYRLAGISGYDLHTEIDRKMAVNRQRKWRKDGTGHGYHVKEEE